MTPNETLVGTMTPHTTFARYQDEDVVWVTVINEYYTDFTKNFLLSMREHDVSFPFIIYCINMSEDKMRDLLDYGNDKVSVLSADQFMKNDVTNGMTIYATNDYKKIVFSKLDAIKYTMSQSREFNIKNVGYMDTDIVIFKNPTDVITETMPLYPDVDVVSQCDEGEKQCSDSMNCPKICSGVIVFRNKPSMENLFGYKDEDVDKYEGDQDYLLVEMRKQNVKFLTIDKDIFQNGIVFYNIKEKNELITDKLCLVHFNWMPNFTKQDKMREYGVWYL